MSTRSRAIGGQLADTQGASERVSDGGEMAAPLGGVYGQAGDEALKAGDKYV